MIRPDAQIITATINGESTILLAIWEQHELPGFGWTEVRNAYAAADWEAECGASYAFDGDGCLVAYTADGRLGTTVYPHRVPFGKELLETEARIRKEWPSTDGIFVKAP